MTTTQLRLLNILTRHGEFLRFAFVEIDTTGMIRRYDVAVNAFDTVDEAKRMAIHMRDAARLPIITIQ